MNIRSILLGLLLGASVVHADVTGDEVVLRDDGLSISAEELQYMVDRWTPQMRQAAADDVGDRLELLNIMMAKKKMAREADQVSHKDEPDLYWHYQFLMRGAKQRFLLQNHASRMDMPDMSELAKERYKTDKDKYALVLEERLSSHILFRCLPRQCDREQMRPAAEAVLKDLQEGADFAAMVKEHSGDPGSKLKGGRFAKWLKLGEPGVEPAYSKALFDIDKPGGYSGVVESRFGFHIIRLDEVNKQHYLKYSEVKPKIVVDLQAEYKTMALKDYENQFMLTDDAFIDGDAMEKILSPYKTSNAK